MIEQVLALDSVTPETIDILSSAILGEAQQVSLTGVAISHLDATVNLFSRHENETVDSMDGTDASVSVTM